jgi:Nitroreductase family
VNLRQDNSGPITPGRAQSDCVPNTDSRVKIRNGHAFVPLEFEHLALEEQLRRAREFESRMQTRRTVRKFSARTVERELIESALRVGSRAPSGANQQPWRFVGISAPEIKRKIRLGAEAEEKQNYEERFPREWLDALAPLETHWHKEFLEIAPWLIGVFRIAYGIAPGPGGFERKINTTSCRSRRAKALMNATAVNSSRKGVSEGLEC